MNIDPINSFTHPLVMALATQSWGGALVAVHGKLLDLEILPCFVAQSGGEVIGYCFYRVDGTSCEIIALESVKQNRGIGSALIEKVKDQARQVHCKRLYLQTTNDNCHALRFYQRRGFNMSAVRLNELDRSRQLKPSIPLIGDEGMPLQHEIEFEVML